MQESVHEAAIIGAGPIGLEVAVALKARGIDSVHVEAGELGATMGWWAPGTKYFSSPERIAIAGVPLVTPSQDKATREQYLDYLRAVATQFDLAIRTFTRVIDVERTDEGVVLHTVRSTHGVGGPEEWGSLTGRRPGPLEGAAPWGGDSERVRARRVILAIGDMHRPRVLGIPGEDFPFVSHYFRGPHRHFRRRVLIVGGKNSAVEAALRCWRAGARVTISYRAEGFSTRVKYWLRPELEWLIDKGRIGFLPRTAPVGIEPDGRVHLAETDEAWAPIAGSERTFEADDVLLLTGYEQDKTLFERLGVELVGAGGKPRHDRETMETNVPGVYVAGTAAAGTQLGGVKLFIENAHVHAERIAAHMAGEPPPSEAATGVEALPES